jgi:hypothetical protein
MPKMLHESLNAKLQEEFPDVENAQAEDMKLKVQFDFDGATHEREVMTNDEYDSFDFGEINTLSKPEDKASEEEEVGSSDKSEAETEDSDKMKDVGGDTVKMYTEDEVKAMLEEKAAEVEKMMEEKGYMNKKSEAPADEKSEEGDQPESEPEKPETSEGEAKTGEEEPKSEAEDKPDASDEDVPQNQKSMQPEIMGEYDFYSGFVS